MTSKPRTIVALSGGVDSAVAALLLQDAGREVEALFMSNWEEDEDGYCTSAADFQDARRICAELGIPLHKVSFAKEYRERVFAHFLSELRAGRTPNPDVLCNRETKFGSGLGYARRLGALIAYAGDGSLNYRFYANDGVAEATGSPTSNNRVTVLSSSNNPPSLDWVVATCFTDGVKPAEGPNGGDFEFLVNYTDDDNQCPPTANDIQVWIDGNDNGTYDEGEKYNLAEADASDTTCSDGKLYKVTRTLSLAGDNTFNYRFYASDGSDIATGDPISNNTVTIVDALKVRPSGGSGWYSTIQSAVDAIDGAHTVLVYEGIVSGRSARGPGAWTVRSIDGPDRQGPGCVALGRLDRWAHEVRHRRWIPRDTAAGVPPDDMRPP